MPQAPRSVSLDAELEERLDALSALSGRSVAELVREARLSSLGELEYAYALVNEAERVRLGELETCSSAVVAEELGLRDS